MADQPLQMQGEEIVFQHKAFSISGKGILREGELYLTNKRIIWQKIGSGKLFLKSMGNVVGTAINAAGESNISIPLHTINAIGPFQKKIGIEILTNDMITYKFTLKLSGLSSKGLDEKRDSVIRYIQNTIR